LLDAFNKCNLTISKNITLEDEMKIEYFEKIKNKYTSWQIEAALPL